MKPATYAHSFIRALQRRGIGHVFANSGTDHAPLVAALASMNEAGEPTPRFHLVPHENLAMAMAQGYYRASGLPAAVLVHVTVGTANTLCSLMNAWRSGIPVLVVAGRNPLSQEGHAGSRSAPIHWGQDAFDQNALVRENTKWEHELRAYQDVDALVDRALTIAMSEPRGPVYLTLPRELLADEDTMSHANPTGTIDSAAPSAEAIEQLAAALAGAAQPAIITSMVGVDRASSGLLERVAGEFALPVIQFWPYASNLRSDHPMNLRMQGADWLAEADVILTIDTAVPWLPRRFKPRDDANVIHLGADPTYSMYPYRDFPATRLVAGSSRLGLRMLADSLASKDIAADRIGDRAKKVAAIVESNEKRRRERIAADRGRAPVSAAWTAHCINEAKGENSVVVNELGVPFEFLEFSHEDLFIGETTAGGLGSGIGFGLGAKLASPDRDVICCVGDGSFMFGNPTPALFVSDALEIPVTIVVCNNGMWYAVEESTLDIFPDHSPAGEADRPLSRFRSSPDYAALARACGAHGATVKDPAELEDALREALRQNRNGKAAVLDVITEAGTR